jgi:hypothetical protein
MPYVTVLACRKCGSDNISPLDVSTGRGATERYYQCHVCNHVWIPTATELKLFRQKSQPKANPTQSTSKVS